MQTLSNLLSQLPGLSTEAEPTEADEKEARIQFHRDRVRNGPASFKAPTNGQIRRARQRDAARQTKKARRNQVRQHFDDRREAAVLRGCLQALGVLPYARTGRRPSETEMQTAARWAVVEYGDASAPISGTDIEQAVETALQRYQVLVGAPVTDLNGNPA